MQTRAEEEELFLDLAMVEQERVFKDLICYGRASLYLDGLLSDATHERMELGGWPTRDSAAPEEVC